MSAMTLAKCIARICRVAFCRPTRTTDILWSLSILVQCHLPDYASTPSNKIDQFCSLADTCIHDTIPICGKMGDEKRTFLDLCDLLEFACDTNQIFVHVEDMAGCPNRS